MLLEEERQGKSQRNEGPTSSLMEVPSKPSLTILGCSEDIVFVSLPPPHPQMSSEGKIWERDCSNNLNVTSF